MKNSDYAAEVHKPTAMIDSATLTGAMVIALGSGTTGVFCKNDNLWSLIEKSGFETGDRAWRMPHYKHYFGKTSQIILIFHFMLKNRYVKRFSYK